LGLRFTNAPGTFSFSAHHFSQSLLTSARHREDLKNENMVFLSLDGFVRGTGTASCGPDVFSQYQIDSSKPLAFSFAIFPVAAQ
jgi:hypothetical protein